MLLCVALLRRNLAPAYQAVLFIAILIQFVTRYLVATNTRQLWWVH